MGCSVMSVTHFWFGAVAVKLRPNRSLFVGTSTRFRRRFRPAGFTWMLSSRMML